MSKMPKKARRDLDEAIDRLGGGAAPISPRVTRRVTKARKAAKVKRRAKKR